MTCLQNFNHKKQVQDEYDIITTINQNNEYGWLWHKGSNQDDKYRMIMI